MNNARALWMFAISIILGIIVTAMAVVWVGQKGSIRSDKIAVAAMDIQLGSKIDPQMITTVDWPTGSVPQGAFVNLTELHGRVVKSSIQRGEPILDSRLAPVGTQGGLSAVIAEGKRAMTVRVNDVIGVAGFALPGNYVDVMINTQREKTASSGEENRQISITVLERVLVLAVAQEASRDDTKPKVVNAVTLELTPEEAEKLDLARNVGTLSLVLRNQVDKKSIETTGATKKQLFGEKPAPVVKQAPPAAPARQVVEVVRYVPAPIAPAPPPEPRNCVEVIQNNARTQHCF